MGKNRDDTIFAAAGYLILGSLVFFSIYLTLVVLYRVATLLYERGDLGAAFLAAALLALLTAVAYTGRGRPQ